MRHEVDAVVVGGGPAGLAAASWLGRYRRSVVVVDSEDYRSGMVERSHGYLGRDPQKPVELIARGRDEVCAYPTTEIRPGRVERVERREDGLFAVGDNLLCHRLVLACGVKDVFPDVGGFATHYGASVFHCPACDGYETRDRDVVALGWDPHLVGFSSTLLNWARSVTVVTNGRRFQGDDSCRAVIAENGNELVERDAVRFVGERGNLTGLELDDGTILPTSLVFFSVAHEPRTDLAASLGCEIDDEGYVVVDREGQTSVEGVYAAGDLTPGLQLVQVAAAGGATAGVGAAQSLFGCAGAPTSPTPAPDPTQPGQGG
ncbi:MAG TPA: NAD(P)/FAD-dependent oxidoreductase [Mycobacteriales bacterium]|jgi:thioredoxin reductase|nr:NAD(P)/FAD-dependent oxidoreductase [Mycobacteriales bacterium]